MPPLAVAHLNYETDITEVVIKGRRYRFLIPKSLENFIDSEDIFNDFPLWAKMWEASVVLADHVAHMPPEPEKCFLEIGAGLALPSIVGASLGHRVTMTDSDSKCLEFARANAQFNEISNIEIMALDWNEDLLEGSFDYIVGSEVVYSEKSFMPLLRLLEAHLKPEGEVILTALMRPTSMKFFAEIHPLFDMIMQKKVLRSKEKEIPVILARMAPKK